MPHKSRKQLLSFWATVMLFTLAADSKAEETLQPHKKIIKPELQSNTLGNLGFIYGAIGRRDEAQGVLNQLFEMKKRQNALPLTWPKFTPDSVRMIKRSNGWKGPSRSETLSWFISS